MTTHCCEACGTEYDDVVENIRPHARRVYDPFDCAVHRPTRRCPVCGCPMVALTRMTDDGPLARTAAEQANR